MATRRRAELDRLYDEMQACKQCRIGELAENVLDTGLGYGKLRGYGEGRFMFVAQNPSRIRPPHIVTPCDAGVGRDLLWLLQKERFEDQDIFFTNLVKCSTEHNRQPSALEKRNCTRHWLKREVQIIEPILIIPVGRVASKHFGGDIAEETRYRGIRVFSIWHPSYVLPKGRFEEYSSQLQKLVELKDKLKSLYH